MTLWFEGRSATSVIVAFIASTDAAVIVNPGAASEGRGGMTEVAIEGGRDVIGIDLGSRADRGNTVVTRRAVVHDADMIKRCGPKSRGLMAVTAITVGW